MFEQVRSDASEDVSNWMLEHTKHLTCNSRLTKLRVFVFLHLDTMKEDTLTTIHLCGVRYSLSAREDLSNVLGPPK